MLRCRIYICLIVLSIYGKHVGRLISKDYIYISFSFAIINWYAKLLSKTSGDASTIFRSCFLFSFSDEMKPIWNCVWHPFFEVYFFFFGNDLSKRSVFGHFCFPKTCKTRYFKYTKIWKIKTKNWKWNLKLKTHFPNQTCIHWIS